MGNLLRKGQAWLNRTHKAHAASQVYYVRDGLQSDGIAATVTQSQQLTNVAGNQQAVVSADRFDFILDSEDLVVNGVIVTPKSGDAIRYGTGLYAVADNPGTGACWRPTGTIPGRIRVHTLLNG